LDRGGAAGAVGDRLAGAAEPQDLDELLEDDPVADPGPVAAQRVGRDVFRADAQESGTSGRKKLFQLPTKEKNPTSATTGVASGSATCQYTRTSSQPSSRAAAGRPFAMLEEN
jgi:hypothetical protein